MTAITYSVYYIYSWVYSRKHALSIILRTTCPTT